MIIITSLIRHTSHTALALPREPSNLYFKADGNLIIQFAAVWRMVELVTK